MSDETDPLAFEEQTNVRLIVLTLAFALLLLTAHVDQQTASAAVRAGFCWSPTKEIRP